jgi:hypothetical protein
MKNKQRAVGKAEQIAVIVKKASRTANIRQFANNFLMLLVLLAFAECFAYFGVPWFICLGVVVIALVFFALGVLRYRRISAAAAKTDASETAAEAGDISLDPGEVLVDTIPAVMRYGKTRSVEVLGTGKVLTPENALLITNKAVWAINVPMSGQHQAISGADAGKWQWMAAYGEIAGKLKDMVSSIPLQSLMEQCSAKRLMRLTEIKRAHTLPMTYAISLMSFDKRKFGYSIRTKEDFLKAKRIFGISARHAKS